MSSNDAEDASPSPDPESDQDESEIMAEDKNHRVSSEEKSPGQSSNGTKPATKSNNKDPSRPRRKKARRACHACQRAHLTCGDERPCIRCIKRGIEGNCHDGVRKKAKYLHDAPAEALLPGYQGSYTGNGTSISSAAGASMPMSGLPTTQPTNYFPTPNSQYSQYNQIQPQVLDNVNMVGNITQRPSVGSPTQYQQAPPPQQVTPVQEMSTGMNRPGTMGSIGGNPSFEASLFDNNDLTAFNFNLQDLNFGNHYGALEFGMLGHMTSGAVNTPEMEMMDSMSHGGSISYDGGPGFQSFPYTQNFQAWNNRQGSTTNLWALQHNGQDAFAVADTGGSLTGASPHSQNQDWNTGYSSNTVSPETHFVQPDHNRHHDHHGHHRPGRLSAPFPTDFGPMTSRKRRRDTKHIYESVTKPYPYTERFHTFFAFLQRRYPTDKRVRIAKALSDIRPSFIALTKDLSEDDLIFMEKGFQRQLVDYDDTWQQMGTPSIICRRTGEVVSCNKEFSLVTGWGRDVLLGRAPNLNVNYGIAASGTQTGTNTRGTATPRIPGQSDSDTTTDQQPSVPQPVFLAELMDQDSMVEFWEDFSERAFAGSTPSVTSAGCTLIKYKTNKDPGWRPDDTFEGGVKKEGTGDSVFVKGEAGMKALGEQNGKIEVSMTWLVRRDMFDIPMMIVMNFLPVI